jgi:acyl-CoA thioester hydrolase
MIDCAFDHSTAVGLPESTCRKLARGMAAVKCKVDLLGSAYEQDSLKIATWIVEPDGKLRLSRQFQIINADTNKTLARGLFNFVPTWTMADLFACHHCFSSGILSRANHCRLSKDFN